MLLIVKGLEENDGKIALLDSWLVVVEDIFLPLFS